MDKREKRGDTPLKLYPCIVKYKKIGALSSYLKAQALSIYKKGWGDFWLERFCLLYPTGTHGQGGGRGGGFPSPESRPLFNNVRNLIYCIPPLASPKKLLLAHVGQQGGYNSASWFYDIGISMQKKLARLREKREIPEAQKLPGLLEVVKKRQKS